jgi:hypothetical protein
VDHNFDGDLDAVPCGTVVELTPVPDDCYEFTSWTGPSDIITNDNKNTNLLPITMNKAISVEAVFALKGPLGLTVDITGEGTVTAKIESQEVNLTDDLQGLACGTVVELTAEADEFYKFVEWRDGDGNTVEVDEILSVTVDDNKVILAVFSGIFAEEVRGGELIVDTANQRYIGRLSERHFKFRYWSDAGRNNQFVSAKNPLPFSDPALVGVVELKANFGVPVCAVTVEGGTVAGSRIDGTDNFVWGTLVTVRVPDGSIIRDVRSGREYPSPYTFIVLVEREFEVVE